jgi:hypothetical protein
MDYNLSSNYSNSTNITSDFLNITNITNITNLTAIGISVSSAFFLKINNYIIIPTCLFIYELKKYF